MLLKCERWEGERLAQMLINAKKRESCKAQCGHLLLNLVLFSYFNRADSHYCTGSN